jgi:hypothetical protein
METVDHQQRSTLDSDMQQQLPSIKKKMGKKDQPQQVRIRQTATNRYSINGPLQTTQFNTINDADIEV